MFRVEKEKEFADTKSRSVDLGENLGEPDRAGRAAVPCVGRRHRVETREPGEGVEILGNLPDELMGTAFAAVPMMSVMLDALEQAAKRPLPLLGAAADPKGEQVRAIGSCCSRRRVRMI